MRQLGHDELDVFEGQRFSLVVHGVAFAPEFHVLQDQHTLLGVLTGNPAEEWTPSKETCVLKVARTFF